MFGGASQIVRWIRMTTSTTTYGAQCKALAAQVLEEVQVKRTCVRRSQRHACPSLPPESTKSPRAENEAAFTFDADGEPWPKSRRAAITFVDASQTTTTPSRPPVSHRAPVSKSWRVYPAPWRRPATNETHVTPRCESGSRCPRRCFEEFKIIIYEGGKSNR